MTGQECFRVTMNRGGAVLSRSGEEAVRKACPFPRSDARFQAGEEDKGQRSSTSVCVITRCAKEEKTLSDASSDHETDRLAFFLFQSNKNKNVETHFCALFFVLFF